VFALRLSPRFCPDDLAAFLAELYGQQKVPVLKVITSRRNCSACINGRIPSGVFGEIPLCGRRWFPDGGIDQVRSLSLSLPLVYLSTYPTDFPGEMDGGGLAGDAALDRRHLASDDRLEKMASPTKTTGKRKRGIPTPRPRSGEKK